MDRSAFVNTELSLYAPCTLLRSCMAFVVMRTHSENKQSRCVRVWFVSCVAGFILWLIRQPCTQLFPPHTCLLFVSSFLYAMTHTHTCVNKCRALQGRVGRVGGSDLEGSKLHACNLRTLVMDVSAGNRAQRDEVANAIRQARESVRATQEQVGAALDQLAESHQFTVSSLLVDGYTRQLESLIKDCPDAVFDKALKKQRRDTRAMASSGGASANTTAAATVLTKEVVLAALRRTADDDEAAAAAAGGTDGGVPVEAARTIADQLCRHWLEGLPPPEPVVESENALLAKPLVIDIYSKETVAKDEEERLQLFENDPAPNSGRRGGKAKEPNTTKRSFGPRYELYSVKLPVASSRTTTSENARALLLNRSSVWKLSPSERSQLVAMVLRQQYETAATAYAEAQTLYVAASPFVTNGPGVSTLLCCAHMLRWCEWIT